MAVWMQHLKKPPHLSVLSIHAFLGQCGVSCQPPSQRSSIRCIPCAKSGRTSTFSRIPDRLLCRMQATGLFLDFWERAASWTEDTDLATVSVIVPVRYGPLMPPPSSLSQPADGFHFSTRPLGSFFCRAEGWQLGQSVVSGFQSAKERSHVLVTFVT